MKRALWIQANRPDFESYLNARRADWKREAGTSTDSMYATLRRMAGK